MKPSQNLLQQLLIALGSSALVISSSQIGLHIKPAFPQNVAKQTPQPNPIKPPTPQPQPTIPPTPEPLRGKNRIVFVGDSITQGGGQYGGYVWLLQRYLNTLYPQQKLEMISSGVSGNTSAQLSERFQRDVLDKKPDLVIINVGINDVLQSFQTPTQARPNLPSPQEYRQNLAAMVQATQARGISVVLLSPTLIYENLSSQENQRLTQYISMMREVSNQYRCQYIDLNVAFRHVITTYQRYGGQAQNLLTRDGIHPNIAGHQIIAYTLLKGWGVPEQQIQSMKLNP